MLKKETTLRLFITISAVLLSGMYTLINPVKPAFAAEVCGTKTTVLDGSFIPCKKSDDNKKSDLESNAIWGILLFVISVLTAGVGILAVGGIIYGAILYTTAQDNSGQITKSKETIAHVVVGLILYAFMWSLLQFLIPGGVFIK
ncbi:hypothetical protein KC952_00195 [Candidatus Saccharibacteria bacterium]|nr:hypothetical protein [Candidatus Saccharibacteria bacterium]